jgi:hypothetical protein
MCKLGDIDCHAEAEQAMKMASATNGFERAKWLRIALGWHDLEAGRASWRIDRTSIHLLDCADSQFPVVAHHPQADRCV